MPDLHPISSNIRCEQSFSSNSTTSPVSLYAILRRFPDERQDGQDPLDKLDNSRKDPFGSYHQLIQQEKFRFSTKGSRPNP